MSSAQRWTLTAPNVALEAIVGDLGRGAEAYLQMWERAAQAGGRRARRAPTSPLRRAGQPKVRGARRWTYYVKGGRMAAALTRSGHVSLVGSTARPQGTRGPAGEEDGEGPARTAALRGVGPNAPELTSVASTTHTVVELTFVAAGTTNVTSRSHTDPETTLVAATAVRPASYPASRPPAPYRNASPSPR